jgi:hypothetical protein
MKYLLALYGDEGAQADAPPQDPAAMIEPWTEYGRKITEAGVFVAGEALTESSTATTLRITDSGERVVTDGPFAETKEQLGGFYLLDCKNLDEAIEWARRLPMTQGAVEIRPVMDYTQFGYEPPEASR